MDEKTKRTRVREAGIFAVYCVVVVFISRFSSVSRTVADGVVHTKFFLDLFILHLLSWILVYPFIRVAIWAVRKWMRP